MQPITSRPPASAPGNEAGPRKAMREARKPKGGAKGGAERSVVIGVKTFEHLRVVQRFYAPEQPRMDMRYWVDGAMALLGQGDGELTKAWVVASLQAMVNDGQRKLAMVEAGAEGTSGTQGGQVGDGGSSGDCKSLQISEASFKRLMAQQQTSKDPRLGMRYLLEGGLLALIQRRELLAQDWADQARRARQAHRASLASPHQP